jgi:hypothetical protein
MFGDTIKPARKRHGHTPAGVVNWQVITISGQTMGCFSRTADKAIPSFHRNIFCSSLFDVFDHLEPAMRYFDLRRLIIFAALIFENSP